MEALRGLKDFDRIKYAHFENQQNYRINKVREYLLYVYFSQ